MKKAFTMLLPGAASTATMMMMNIEPMRRTFVAIAMIALGCAASGVTAKPVIQEEVLWVTSGSVENLTAKAESIVRVSVLASKTVTITSPASPSIPAVWTEHEVKILEVMKGSGRKGSTFRVLQKAGTVELSDFIVTVSDVQPFHPGDELLLFLTWYPTGNAFTPAADGAFYVENHRLRPHLPSATTKALAGLTVQEAAEVIRRVGR